MSIGKKVCMLGDFGVGKTSLVRRYVLNEFSTDYQTTLGVNVYKREDEIEGPGGAPIALLQVLWDIEGGLQRQSLLDSYLQGASGAIVVGDVTARDPLVSMRTSAERFRDSCPGRPAVFALNKIDLLEHAPRISGTDALASDFGGVLRYTSAATGEAVAELFCALGLQMLKLES